MEAALFLDIDDVVNVIPSDKHKLLIAQKQLHKTYLKGSWTEWKEFLLDKNDGFKYVPILFSPQLISELNALSKKVEVVWNTSWGNDAVRYFAPQVGLDAFQVAPFGGSDNPSHVGSYFDSMVEHRWWKINSIINHILHVKTPFIWADDDITKKAYDYIKNLADAENVKCLIVIPRKQRGISPDEIASMWDFIKSLK